MVSKGVASLRTIQVVFRSLLLRSTPHLARRQMTHRLKGAAGALKQTTPTPVEEQQGNLMHCNDE